MSSASQQGPRRRFAVGCAPELTARLEAAFGGEFAVEVPADPQPGDLVVLGSLTPGALPFGNVFSASRALKREPRVAVYLALAAGDPFGAEIARFCLADGIVGPVPDPPVAEVPGLEAIQQRWRQPRERASADELLERLEREIAGDEGRQASAVQRILDAEASTGFMAELTDPETGLFDGPFASFKLDEEFKRARRFHQPLSLVLLDCGVDQWPTDAAARGNVLAEVASIFLVECRDIDVLARFTETVFLFLLPGTGAAGAESLARRVDAALRERQFSVPLEVRPALGIATMPAPEIPDRRVFLARAEACLRIALESEPGGDGGRIRVDQG